MLSSIEYKITNSRMESLLKKLTEAESLAEKDALELDKISSEIADYEEANFPFEAETLKEMIELRMYQRKLKQKDLAVILGTTPSRISEILNGKRSLTIELAKNLHKKLNIDADLILNS
ncbi:helix-turn-helix domain-containing protein [Aequorivita capsosiphonis]|uniref:helix-turn-helix domain-containing protein n=1 Tax=Aequorivita capsosiphonis TaxID=487317 RepID=UPI0005529978|nr:helix-turn-helix domain-containing protein [Aequorivita capsosiphonis]